MTSIIHKNYLDKIIISLKNNYKKLVFLFLLSGLFFVYKLFSLIILILILDFIVSYVDNKYRIDLMFDFLPLGLITISYALSYKYGLILTPLFLPARIILGKLSKRHFIKLPILAILSILAYLFNSYNIAVLGFILFILRYFLEYLIDYLISGGIDTRRIPRRIGHLAASYVFFSFFGEFLVNFLRS
ncbi:hypothetical protein JXB41_01155 [Candidatus Woesearchaeota archaeon]|nr:hypothetical protein [Candidatus Woesearchaeota archaeon]